MKKSQSSDYFTRLEKTLAIDDEGNATFSKSVLADGTIGGNSGLKPLHEYYFMSGEKLVILDQRFSTADAGFIGFGYVDDLDTIYPTIFYYSLNDDNKVIDFNGITNALRIKLVDGQLVMNDIAITQ